MLRALQTFPDALPELRATFSSGSPGPVNIDEHAIRLDPQRSYISRTRATVRETSSMSRPAMLSFDIVICISLSPANSAASNIESKLRTGSSSGTHISKNGATDQ